MLRAGRSPAGLKIVRIDIDPAEMRRLTPPMSPSSPMPTPARAIWSPPSEGRHARPAAAAQRSARPRRRRRRRSRRSSRRWRTSNILRDVLPENGIVSDEMSQVGFASWFGFPVHEPRTFITSGFQGTLGSGFPTALGVKVAQSRPAGGGDHRRRRLPVRRAGAGDRRAVRHQPGDRGVQQQRLRQRAARPARALRRPRGGVRSGQPGFRQARGVLWRRQPRASPRRTSSRRRWKRRWPMAGPI